MLTVLIVLDVIGLVVVNIMAIAFEIRRRRTPRAAGINWAVPVVSGWNPDEAYAERKLGGRQQRSCPPTPEQMFVCWLFREGLWQTIREVARRTGEEGGVTVYAGEPILQIQEPATPYTLGL